MIRDSIANQLIRWVFFCYCIVAVSVTGVQVYTEYQDTQQKIMSELSSYEKIFNKVLMNAMWNLDREGLAVVLNSMVSVPVIEGVKISRDVSDEIFMGRGRIVEEGLVRHFDEQFNSRTDLSRDTIFFHQYALEYNYAGTVLPLATVSLYSSSAVVMSRVKTGFIFLLVNAMVKTIALWLIFLFFCRRILIKPLNTLTKKVKDINFDNLQSIDFSAMDSHTQSHEMHQLNLAFVEMAHKLAQAKNSVENFNSRLELKVLERTEQLAIEKDRAVKAESIKSDFLARISHEMRTPLNGMIGMLDVLEEDSLGEKQTRQILIVKRSAHALLQLMNDILGVSETASNEQTLTVKAENLLQTLTEITDAYQPILHEKDLQFNPQIDIHYPNVFMDHNRFSQIVHKLLGNACKFTSSGRIELHCHDDLCPDGKHSLFTCKVMDSGIGIEQEKLNKLANVFAATDRCHEVIGSQSGLSFVKKLCEAMDGRIWVESQQGQGSTFCFEIKLALNGHTKPIASSAKPMAPLSGHVLLVEDNKINQEAMTDMLAAFNLSCDVANNGQEGLACITGGTHYSLVIMDCQMPLMDGFECTVKIRQYQHERGLPHLPIVALTANAQQKDLQKCLEVGMDRALTKPLEMKTLQRVLTEYLQG